MDIQELINKYEHELESLKQEKRYNISRNFNEGTTFNAGEIIQVQSIIEDLKKLNVATVKRSELIDFCHHLFNTDRLKNIYSDIENIVDAYLKSINVTKRN